MPIVDEKNFRILIACENQTYRNNLGSKLRFEGFNVEFATGGFHLLHLLEQFDEYNLIIVNENMRDMSAYEMISLLRNYHPKNILPVIYISTKMDEDEVIEMISIGANDYILQASNLAPVVERTKKYFSVLKNS